MKKTTLSILLTLLIIFTTFTTTLTKASTLTQSQIQSILFLLQSFGAPQSTINQVKSALTGKHYTTNPTHNTNNTTPHTPTTNITPPASIVI